MRIWDAGLAGILLPCGAFAQSPAPPRPPVAFHASYQTYAAGIHVADVAASFSFGPWTYQMNLAYHTTGMVGLFLHGHQFDNVTGSWHGIRAEPSAFIGKGEWHGVDRIADIAYQQGRPVIRQLLPPNADEREQVPASLQDHTIDTLSALAQLIRVVTETGHCETTVRTYDGRRAVDIAAHTVGEQALEADSRSSFTGQALRCDFAGHMVAGFKFDDDRERDSKPMHGSAWLAPVVVGGPPLPVRLVFETRWFGDATMYLTGIGQGDDLKVAGGN